MNKYENFVAEVKDNKSATKNMIVYTAFKSDLASTSLLSDSQKGKAMCLAFEKAGFAPEMEDLFNHKLNWALQRAVTRVYGKDKRFKKSHVLTKEGMRALERCAQEHFSQEIGKVRAEMEEAVFTVAQKSLLFQVKNNFRFRENIRQAANVLLA